MKTVQKLTFLYFMLVMLIACKVQEGQLEKVEGAGGFQRLNNIVILQRVYEVETEEDSTATVTLPEAAKCGMIKSDHYVADDEVYDLDDSSEIDKVSYIKKGTIELDDDYEVQLEFTNNENSNFKKFQEHCSYVEYKGDHIEEVRITYEYKVNPDDDDVDAPNAPDIFTTLRVGDDAVSWILRNSIRNDNDTDYVGNVRIITEPKNGVIIPREFEQDEILEYELLNKEPGYDHFSFTMEDEFGNESREIHVHLSW